MGSLYEKYRPRQWDAVVGQDSIIRRLALIDKKFGLLGQVFWLAGPSGCGKTTIARLIVARRVRAWIETANPSLRPIRNPVIG